MDIEKAEQLLINAIKGFHGKFKKIYGQIYIRVDSATYLGTGDNKALSDIRRSNFELCDISSGDIGSIFRSRSDINAIIFGCSADMVKVSEAGNDISVSLEDLAMLTGSRLQIIPSASTRSILSALNRSSVCLIKGIGGISACSNLNKAVAGISIIEKACEAENHGNLIGGAVPIKRSLAEYYRKIFLSDYINRNEDPYVDYVDFDEEEFRLRSQLVDCGRQLLKKDLSYGSWGNLSLRLNKNEMLITPSSMDFFEIKVEDIVRVDIDTLEYGKQRMPSSEMKMHAEAYRRLSDCDAIIHTRSNAVSVFAACEAGFKLNNDELHNLFGDVKATDYAVAGSDELAKAVVDTLSGTHACIIPHHGGVFYGPSLDVVLAIAEAVEMRARNLLNFDVPVNVGDGADDGSDD